MDKYLPLSPSSVALHSAVGVSNTTAKRKRLDPVPHDSATRASTTQSAAGAASWFPGSPLSSQYLNHPFSDFPHHPHLLSDALFMDICYPPSPSSVAPHRAADVSNAPATRKRFDSAPHDTVIRTSTTTSAPGAASWLPGFSRSYQFSNHAFNPSTDEAFVATGTAVSASLQESTPHYPQDGSEPPSKRRRASNAPSKLGRVSDAPSRRARGSKAPSKRGHVSNAPPHNSVLSAASFPGNAMFNYPAKFLPSLTPPTATGSPLSFVEGSSKDRSTANRILGETAVRLPSPGAFSTTYPRYTDEFLDSFSVQDYELSPLCTGKDAPDFLEFGADTWRPAYKSQVYLSANSPTASGSSHAQTRFLHPTAPTPLIRTSVPLENGSPDGDIPLGQRPSGSVTYFDHRREGHCGRRVWLMTAV